MALLFVEHQVRPENMEGVSLALGDELVVELESSLWFVFILLESLGH